MKTVKKYKTCWVSWSMFTVIVWKVISYPYYIHDGTLSFWCEVIYVHALCLSKQCSIIVKDWTISAPGWISSSEPRRFWDFVKVACKSMPHSCVSNIDRLDYPRTSQGKVRLACHLVVHFLFWFLLTVGSNQSIAPSVFYFLHYLFYLRHLISGSRMAPIVPHRKEVIRIHVRDSHAASLAEVSLNPFLIMVVCAYACITFWCFRLPGIITMKVPWCCLMMLLSSPGWLLD